MPSSARWPALCLDNDIFERVRQCLRDDARQLLRSKLKSTNFIRPSLEIGKDRGKAIEGDVYNHGREWKDFRIEDLLEPGSRHVLVANVGCGKTTLIYWLAWELTKRTSLVPLVIPLLDLDRLSISARDDLLAHVGHRWQSSFEPRDLQNFFHNADKAGTLLFLLDGLDQIWLKGPTTLAEDLMSLVGPHRLILSSRPSAALGLEERREIPFLRIQPF